MPIGSVTQNHGASGEDIIQELSIRKLSVAKLKKLTDRLLKNEAKTMVTLAERIALFVRMYLDEINDRSISIREIKSTGAPLPEGLQWNPERYGFSFIPYLKYRETESKLAHLINQIQGTDIEVDKKEIEFLFFLVRTVEKVEEVYAITTGSAYEVVKKATSYKFPRQITKRLLEPIAKKKKQIHLTGPIHTSFVLLREKHIETDLDAIDKIFTSSVFPVRRGSSLHEVLGWKSDQSVDIEVQQGSVRILKRLPFHTIPSVIDLFAKIGLGKETRTIEDQEELDNPKFAFLDYIIPSHYEDIEALDLLLVKELWEAFINERQSNLTFAHKYGEDYFSSREFKMTYNKTTVAQWDSPKDINEMMLCLRTALKDCKNLSQDRFSQELKKMLVFYRRPQKKELEKSKFHKYVEGEFRTPEGKTHFKVAGLWYRINLDFLTIVYKTFRSEFKGLMVDPEDQLPDWTGNEYDGHFKASDLENYLIGTTRKNINKEEFSKLLKSLVDQKILSLEKDKYQPVDLTLLKPEEIPDNYRIHFIHFLTEKEKEKKQFKSEGKYNEAILDLNTDPLSDPIYISGDRILVRKIELFDILKRKGRRPLKLCHVKEGFGQKTRDACSQILTAVALLGNDREQVLEEFWDRSTNPTSVKKEDEAYRQRVQTQMRLIGKDRFNSYFPVDKKKIVFVYAFLDESKDGRSLKDELNRRPITRQTLRSNKHISFVKEVQPIEELTKRGYLDSEGYVTPNILFKTEDVMIREFQAFCQDPKALLSLLKTESPVFQSTIARLELLRTRRALLESSYGFQICQINRVSSLFSQRTDLVYDAENEYPLLKVGEFCDLGGTICEIMPTKGSLHALRWNGKKDIYCYLDKDDDWMKIDFSKQIKNGSDPDKVVIQELIFHLWSEYQKGAEGNCKLFFDQKYLRVNNDKVQSLKKIKEESPAREFITTNYSYLNPQLTATLTQKSYVITQQELRLAAILYKQPAILWIQKEPKTPPQSVVLFSTDSKQETRYICEIEGKFYACRRTSDRFAKKISKISHSQLSFTPPSQGDITVSASQLSTSSTPPSSTPMGTPLMTFDEEREKQVTATWNKGQNHWDKGIKKGPSEIEIAEVVWDIIDTPRDGSCAIHALLGEYNIDRFIFPTPESRDPSIYAKEIWCDNFQPRLKGELKSIYEEHIEDLFHQFFQAAPTREAKLVFAMSEKMVNLKERIEKLNNQLVDLLRDKLDLVDGIKSVADWEKENQAFLASDQLKIENIKNYLATQKLPETFSHFGLRTSPETLITFLHSYDNLLKMAGSDDGKKSKIKEDFIEVFKKIKTEANKNKLNLEFITNNRTGINRMFFKKFKSEAVPPEFLKFKKEIEDIDSEKEQLKNEIKIDPRIQESYLSAIKDINYYFSFNELKMISILRNLRFYIFDENGGRARSDVSFQENRADIPPIVLYRIGAHYQRCRIIKR